MEHRMQINQNLTVGAQPTADELKELKQGGYQTVVNLRADGEDEQPLTPQEEGQRLRDLGVEYWHHPVPMDDLSSERVDEFRRHLPRLKKPVFVHCKTGKRAGALAMMHVAVEQGMSGDETLEKAMQMGFECDQPQLVKFVKDYVDAHASVGNDA